MCTRPAEDGIDASPCASVVRFSTFGTFEPAKGGLPAGFRWDGALEKAMPSLSNGSDRGASVPDRGGSTCCSIGTQIDTCLLLYASPLQAR